MKRIILITTLIALALTVQGQTTGTWSKVNARDTFNLSGSSVAEIVKSIISAARNNELPTAKAVYDYGQSIRDARWSSVKLAMPFYSNNPNTSFEALRTYYSSRAGEIVVDTAITISANTTVAAAVRFVGGGSINVTTGNTLTFSSSISADPRSYIFTGAGDYDFDSKAVHALYPYWYGAKGDNSNDDTDEIQKCIDDAIESSVGFVRFLSGYHLITKGILVRNGSNTVTLTIEGKSNYDGSVGTAILCNHNDNFAFGIQGARACVIRDLYLAGLGRSYNPTITQVITNTKTQWSTQYGRDDRYSPFAAVVVDPFKTTAPTGGGYPGFSSQYSNSHALSSQIVLDRVVMRYFVVGVMISPSGVNGNGSELTYRNCTFDRCEYGMALGNTQSRSIEVVNCFFASNAACMDGITFGGQQAPVPNVVGGQFGACKDIFRFGAGQGDFKITSVYAESVYRLGRFTGNNGATINLTNCEIKFCTSTETSLPDAASVLDAPNMKVIMNGGSLQYSTQRPVEMNVKHLLARGVYLNRMLLNNPNGNSNDSRITYEGCQIDGYGSQFFQTPIEQKVFGLDYQRAYGFMNVAGTQSAYYELGTSNRNTAVWSNQNDSGDHTVLMEASATVTVDTVARTATFTCTRPERYRVGDILFTYNNNSTATPSATSKTCSFGIVTSIVSTTITCSHIPSGIASGTYGIYLWKETIFTGTFIGSITSGSNKVVVTSKNTHGPTLAQVWPVGTRVYSKSNQAWNSGLYTGLYVTSVTADTLFLSGNVGSTVSNLEIMSADMACTYYSEDNTYQTSGSTYRTVGYQTGDRIVFSSHAYRASAIVTAGGFTPTVKFIFKPLVGLASARPAPTSLDGGLTYLSTDSGAFEIWDGSAWISSIGAAKYQVLRDDGSNMTARAAANFVSTSTVTAALTDDSGNNETEVALSVPTDGITATQIAANAVGTSEISDNSVANADLRQSAGLSLVGRSANSTGNVADITGTDGQGVRILNNTLAWTGIPDKVYSVQRAIPTTVGNTQEIGVLTHNSGGGGGLARLTVTVTTSGFGAAKAYWLPLTFDLTSGTWYRLSPDVSTGPSGSNDFEVEIKTNTTGSPTGRIDTLRLVRTAGSTAANANCIVQYLYGQSTDTYTETFGTSTSAITAVFPWTAVTMVKNKVGINDLAPDEALDINGKVRVQNRSNVPTAMAGFDGNGVLANLANSSELTITSGSVKLAQQGATTGQVLEWNGTAWAPGTDDTGGGGGDHGALTGLGDDDHTQYMLLAGRSGGQIATGGTASGDDLTLRSTTDATKGDVIIQDQGGNIIFGGGTASGDLRFMEPSGSGTNYTEIQCGAMSANQSYVWPTDAPADGEVLAWHTGGLLSWDAAGGAAFYQTLQIGGTDQTQRAKLNISPTAQINVSYSDDAGNNRSNVEFSIANDAIGTTQIDDGAVGSAELNQMGATTGQLLRWDGSFWNPANFDDDANISDITGDLDNYTPTTWSTENVFTIGADNLWTITGFGALPGGTERTFINTSSNAIIVASGHPDSDASNRVQGPSDYIIGPYGGSLSMRYSNNYSKWYVTNCTYNPGVPAVNGTMGHYYNATVGATTGADWGNIGFGLSGGANATTTPTATLPAGWQLGTSTSATGAASLYFSKTVLNPTFYSSAYMVASTVVYIPTLSDGTQTFTFQFGLIPSPSSTTLAVNNSIGIRYSNGINSGEWEGFTRNNAGTESTADLNVAVAVDTKYILTVVVDKAKTEARFLVNGNYAGRVTTNLPNNVAVGTRAIIVKSAGTTSRTVTIPTYTFYTVYP